MPGAVGSIEAELGGVTLNTASLGLEVLSTETPPAEMADMTDAAAVEPGSMVDPAEQTLGDSAAAGETGESAAEVSAEAPAGAETEIPAEAPAEAPAPLLQTGAHVAESEDDDETHEEAAPPPLPASPIPTQTETPEPWFDAADDVDGGGENEFPVRRSTHRPCTTHV